MSHFYSFMNRTPAGLILLCLASIYGISFSSYATTSNNNPTPANFNSTIKVKLQQPNWTFLLANEPLQQTQARISPNERSFAKSIQPLLDEENYSAVIAAFNQRDTANDSAALCQLRGQIQLIEKDYNGAEQSLLQALKTLPNLALAHRSLSMVYMVKKQYEQAQVHLKKSIEFGVQDAQVLGQLAYVNLQFGQAASAVSGYQQALFLKPNNKQWQQGLLYALLNSHAFDQAQALLDQMLKNDINNSELWLQRGQLALKQQRLSQAATSLEMALMLGNTEVENLATTAKLHIQTGNYNRAVDILVTHLDAFFGQVEVINGSNEKTIPPNIDIETVNQVSAWLASQQHWQRLAKLLKAIENKQQDLPKTYQALFTVYHAQMDIANHKLESAKLRLTQALEYHPSHGEALLSLAELLKSQQRDEQAIQYFVRAQALSQYKERALLGHAQLEIDRKQYEQAIKLLRQVVKMNPDRQDVLANIKTLKNIVRNQA